jgi:peptidoglycan/LPS O-acetylase OafA/YrhL
MAIQQVTLDKKLIATSFRGPSFDLIRLTAATVVLLYHCRGIEYPNIEIDPLFRYSDGFVQFGLLAVLVFFAISGFLVTPGLMRSGNVIEYSVHRVVRIFPALIVVVLFSMVLLGPSLTRSSLSSYFSDPSLYLYAKNALTLTTRYLPGVTYEDGRPVLINGALWTLHFEVLSYVALALMSVLNLLHRRGLFLILCGVSYAIYVVINLAPTTATVLPERFVIFIGLFVYFAVGAALYIFRDRIPFSIALAFVAFVAVMIALPYGVGAIFLPFCLPYIVIVCGLSILPGQSLLKRDLSYGVYLIHAPILAAFSLIFPGVHIWWVAAVIVFCIALFLSYLSWTFIEGPALKQKRALSNWISCRVDALVAAWSRRDRAKVVTTKPN